MVTFKFGSELPTFGERLESRLDQLVIDTDRPLVEVDENDLEVSVPLSGL